MYIACIYLGNGYIYTVQIPRLIIFYTFLMAIPVVIAERSLLNALQRVLLRRGVLERRRILLLMRLHEPEVTEAIGDTDIYQVVGYANAQPIPGMTLDYRGVADEASALIRQGEIDEILSVHTDFSPEEMLEIYEYARIYGVRYRYVTNFFEASRMNTELSFVRKLPCVEIMSIGLRPWGRVLKRIVDIVGSIFFLILLSPVFAVVAILIYIEDPAGPIIFRNLRVGRNGQPFHVFKFRYIRWEYCVKDAYGVKPEDDAALAYEKELIRTQSHRTGPIYKITDDPRKTRIGTFIERYSIDELPQLMNVLTGDMSLIGPRPHQPREVSAYREYQRQVLTLKPGITGMAQVHGRDQLTFDDEVRLDTFYIENWTLLLDIKIFFQTILVVLARGRRRVEKVGE